MPHLLTVARGLHLACQPRQCGGLGGIDILGSEKPRKLPRHLAASVGRALPRGRHQALVKGVQVQGHAISLAALCLLQHCGRCCLLCSRRQACNMR